MGIGATRMGPVHDVRRCFPRAAARKFRLMVNRIDRVRGIGVIRIARLLTEDERSSGRTSKATFLTPLSSALADSDRVYGIRSTH